MPSERHHVWGGTGILKALGSSDLSEVHWLTFRVRVLWIHPKLCKALICFINCIYRCFHEDKDVKILEEILRALQAAVSESRK